MDLCSPRKLATMSTVIFLVAWICPPSLYQHLIEEPDFMFLDWTLLLYYALCTTGFLWGTSVAHAHRTPSSPAAKCSTSSDLPLMAVVMPLVIAIGFCAAGIVLNLRDYPGLIIALLAQGGSDIKNSGLSQNSHFGLANIWLLGVCWWAMWRGHDVDMPRWSRTILRGTLICSVLLCIVAAAVKVSRVDVMVACVGTVVVWIVAHFRSRSVNRVAAFTALIGMATILLGVFVLFSFIRGAASDAFAGDVVGYTLASYNRMSAVIHNRLRYRYGGLGTYTFNCVVFNNMINEVIPFREWFRWPAFMDWWQSEFDATAAAGLDNRLIWSGAFGYVFADLGWFSPIYMFVYGIASGAAWKAMARGSVFGLLTYPWIAFCILFWFGTNNIVENKVLVLILAAAILSVYEKTVRRMCR